jgi:hypothetical protein
MGKPERAHIGSIVTFLVAILIFVQSCRDLGTNPPPQTAAPSIDSIIPDSAAVGDTIRIIGSGFGSSRSSSTLIVGSQTATDIFTWSDTEIRARVPSGAVNTGIVITVDGISSNAKQYHIIGALTPIGPHLTSIVPDSAEVGDLITINGENFGAVQGSSVLIIGTRPAIKITQWTATQIRADVPLLAISDSLTITVGGVTSNSLPFKSSIISYSARVNPVFQSTCIGCHGGTAGLFVDTHAHLMSGTSINGPVVLPGNGEGSYLIRKLRGTAPGSRMPQGGPYLQDEAINKISTWIQQGAANN